MVRKIAVPIAFTVVLFILLLLILSPLDLRPDSVIVLAGTAKPKEGRHNGLRSKEKLPNASPVRIHWKLKIPSNFPCGDLVFRTETSFAKALGRHNHQYLRWNNLDFEKQMAIVVVRAYPNPGFPRFKIVSVWKTKDEVVIIVAREKENRDESVDVPQVVVEQDFGVAINKSNLPVRFSWYDTDEFDSISTQSMKQ